MPASVKEERHLLFQRYQQCTPSEQAVVNLLAVAWGELSKSQITTSLRKILSAGEAAKINMAQMQRNGLIEYKQKSWGNPGLRCNKLIVELVRANSSQTAFLSAMSIWRTSPRLCKWAIRKPSRMTYSFATMMN